MHARHTNGAAAAGACAEPSSGAAAAGEMEMLPAYVAPDPRIRIGCVEFNRQTLVNSPCFWILVGVGLAIGGYYVVRNARN